ncbi:MAG: metal ABC transporter permease [Planctomycetota bacterium]
MLRRRALVGDLISHAALPGLCLAFLVLGTRHFFGMLAGAFVTGLAGVGLITLVCRCTRTKVDAAMGIVLSTFFGAGVVLLSVIQKRPDGAKAGLDTYIFGQAAGIVRLDDYLIAGVCLVSLLVVALLYKEFKVFSFDPEFARAQGWPTLALDVTMMSMFTLVTVVGLQAVGVVLMAAMLIIPGATARFWTNRLGPMLFIAGILGAATGAVGTLLSAGIVERWLGFDPLAFGDRNRSLPTGPLIVLAGASLFLFSVLLAPRRGVVARLWAQTSLRLRTAREHLLRTLYELSEPRLPQVPVISTPQLLEHRAWSRATAGWLIGRARRRGLVETTPEGVRLTESGLKTAGRLVRAHRLWELFLIHGANVAPDHVHRDADAIEHLLTPEIIEQLEASVAGSGDPAGPPEAVPRSPHDVPQPHPPTE